MNCAKCEGPTCVVDSRPKPHKVRRRRRCLSCGHRFTTHELEASSPGNAQETRRLAYRLIAQLTEQQLRRARRTIGPEKSRD